jgi:hypothetical protein
MPQPISQARHVLADDPTRLKPSAELDAERARLVDDYGRSLLDADGLVAVSNLQEMSDQQHRQLVRKFPLIGTASIARWQGMGLAGLDKWEPR